MKTPSRPPCSSGDKGLYFIKSVNSDYLAEPVLHPQQFNGSRICVLVHMYNLESF